MTKRSNAVKRRAKWTRQAAPVVLIVSQAKKTEPKYFEGFQNAKLRVFSHKYGSIIKLNKLQNSISNLQRHEGIQFDEVWIVLDVEESTNLQPCLDLKKQAIKSNIKTVLSNPEFEIWFLMHFEDCKAPISKPNLQSKLNDIFNEKGWGDYRKNRPNLYGLLKEFQPEAIKRAEATRIHHTSLNDHELSNPSTSVDELVKRLNEIAGL